MILLSIGPSCLPASQLQRNNLHLFAGPFDWIRSRNPAVGMAHVIACLRNRFAGLCEDPVRSKDRCAASARYPGVDYPHQDWIEHPEHRLELERRAARFLALVENQCDITFVLGLRVHGWLNDKNTWPQLPGLLQEFYSLVHRDGQGLTRCIAFVVQGIETLQDDDEMRAYGDVENRVQLLWGMNRVPVFLHHARHREDGLVRGNDDDWRAILSEYAGDK